MPVSRRQFASYTAFSASLFFSLLLGGSLTALHTPFRSTASGSAKLVADLIPGNIWRAVHILSGACQCSEDVAHHLLQRGPLPDVKEEVLLAGSNEPLMARLRARGFQTLAVSGDDLAQRYGLAGAPRLLLMSPSGLVVYQGGYAADVGARTGYQDVSLLQQVRRGATPEPLPVFGCALTRQLQHLTDPLALKYPRTKEKS